MNAESPGPAGADFNDIPTYSSKALNVQGDTYGYSGVKAAECPHPVWVTKMRGGELLSVGVCQLCGDINWTELRADFEAKAGLREAFASEDGEVINWKGRNYILQPEPVTNATERAEDAARRYARQLLQLQAGLRERGVDLSNTPEDEMVDLALATLDEWDVERKALAGLLQQAQEDNEDKAARAEEAV